MREPLALIRCGPVSCCSRSCVVLLHHVVRQAYRCSRCPGKSTLAGAVNPVHTQNSRQASLARRHSASMLSALQGPASASIARNMQDYRDMAVQLLLRPHALRRVRESLKENWLSSPLFDVGRWVGDVEVLSTDFSCSFGFDAGDIRWLGA